MRSMSDLRLHARETIGEIQRRTLSERREVASQGPQGGGGGIAANVECVKVVGFGDDFGDNTTFQCRRMNESGTEIGDVFTVWAMTCGSGDAPADLTFCIPNFAVGDQHLRIQRQINFLKTGPVAYARVDGFFAVDTFQRAGCPTT